VDAERNFHFLEMNTRLQVEHPVTEMVTSLDLVKLQIRIAAGEPLAFGQEDVALRGHAIECRIYAEDPDNNFFPCAGRIVSRSAPTGPGIRVDDGVYAGWTVPLEYDSMLGKLCAWGNDRGEAIARLRRALDEYHVSGIPTNVGLFRRILGEPEFVRGEIHTRWLDELLQRTPETAAPRLDSGAEDAATLAAALWHLANNGAAKPATIAAAAESRWKFEGRREQVERAPRRR
jgi:acetyl-CoA carboxylase biotin carboxylase subunit